MIGWGDDYDGSGDDDDDDKTESVIPHECRWQLSAIGTSRHDKVLSYEKPRCCKMN